ncbi:MAG: DNA-directed RNA polymerase subunit beta [Planctomycetota bacterium]
MKIIDFRPKKEFMVLDDLYVIQRQAYERLLQKDIPANERKNVGIESVFREIFPIENNKKTYILEYKGYRVGQPQYSIEECYEIGISYSYPIYVTFRLISPSEVKEEEIYFCEIPALIGGGKYLINGVPRVIVTQIHRAPGIDFTEQKIGDKKFQIATIITERGNWLEVGVTKREYITIKLDAATKFTATLFLRCMSEKYSSTTEIIKNIYPVTKVNITNNTNINELLGHFLAQEIIVENEILYGAGLEIDEAIAKYLTSSAPEDGYELYIIDKKHKPEHVFLKTLIEDAKNGIISTEKALTKFYERITGNPPSNIEVARNLFTERYLSPLRYRIGPAGRYRINRKFGLQISEEEIGLLPDDIIGIIKYIIKMRRREGEEDDIDSLENKRIIPVDEQFCNAFRKSLLKLKRALIERLNTVEEGEIVSAKTLINPKLINTSIEKFFSRSELAQLADETNPLSLLTHQRRLSALGPGGLERKHTGFEVRDVHPSHYGRVCPVETPEGANIGLVISTAIFSRPDNRGFLTTPYRKVKNGVLQNEIVYMNPYEEKNFVIAPWDTEIDKNGAIIGKRIRARKGGEMIWVHPQEIDFIDASYNQILGVSASLIPFFEHDDANRALMGANMQRQAVPLIETEPPLVASGMEKIIGDLSDLVVRAKQDGTVRKVTATRVVIDEEVYEIEKFKNTPDKTCFNFRPIVKVGDKVKKGQVIIDGPAFKNGELALGKNLLVAFMPWEGYNFEDAIVVSRRLLKDHVFSSIYIEDFTVELHDTKEGKEFLTRDLPNIPESKLKNLDSSGLIIEGAYVTGGDILVGKVVPRKIEPLTPEEKLLLAIFEKDKKEMGKAEPFTLPMGLEGRVIAVKRYSRKILATDYEKKELKEKLDDINRKYYRLGKDVFDSLVMYIEEIVGSKIDFGHKLKNISQRENINVIFDWITTLKNILAKQFSQYTQTLLPIINRYIAKLKLLEEEKEQKEKIARFGEKLPIEVRELIRIFIASLRELEAGDKLSGRHGNKGIVAKILPEEDMPYLEDGTPVDVVLNPMGVPSRMNIGQLYETHLGWAAQKLGLKIITPPFAGASEKDVIDFLRKAGLPEDGKVVLYDGRTGQPFKEKVTVGVMYIMKLHHMVADKIHARNTGPYSLITQQPLGGKARMGGQRFGEMEVWALEAYGASHLLQEMLTIKSDDIEGRHKVLEAIAKGQEFLEPAFPSSLAVLVNELRGLGLSVKFGK